jgi:hypothetical protein
MLTRLFFILVASALTVNTISQAQAGDNCHERVQEFRDWYGKDKDKYTLESRRSAEKHLLQAQLPSMNLLQCTEHLLKARKALREGKK